MDEARVGQQGTLTRVWASRGTRPRAVRDHRRNSVYLFGAVCPERGTGAAVVLPLVNVEAMNVHLAEISRHREAIRRRQARQRRACDRGRARRPRARPSRLAHLAQAARAQKHQPAAAAALRAGTEPGGTGLGLPAG